MISTLLMFGVVFKGRILTSHSISANIDIGRFVVGAISSRAYSSFKGA